MPKIRVRSSKPGTKGAYNQGRKLGKARNHTHSFVQVFRSNKIFEVCSIPGCKELHIK